MKNNVKIFLFTPQPQYLYAEKLKRIRGNKKIRVPASEFNFTDYLHREYNYGENFYLS